MHKVSKYFASSFIWHAPLINRPGSAVELPGIIGFGNRSLYTCLVRKVAIKLIFLAVTGLAGPYLLQCFGISFAILQLAGGLVLVGLGAGMLQTEEDLKHGAANKIAEPSVDEADSCGRRERAIRLRIPSPWARVPQRRC
jgi:small neutral amino acid transporter SnatA (MarC family)